MICAGMPTTQRMAEYCLQLANKLILSYAATDLGLVSSMMVTDPSTYVPFDAGKKGSAHLYLYRQFSAISIYAVNIRSVSIHAISICAVSIRATSKNINLILFSLSIFFLSFVFLPLLLLQLSVVSFMLINFVHNFL